VTPPPAVSLDAPGVLAGLVALVVVLLAIDLRFFARGRDPSFKEGAVWSVGWLVLSLLVAIPLWVLDDADAAVNYTTVYLIERSLSLDNLFVFILLFAYFGVPEQYRARLLFWGIVAALVLRGLAILGGVALIEQFHFVIYILGVTLLLLAYRILRGVAENVDPDRNLFVRATRKVATGRATGSGARRASCTRRRCFCASGRSPRRTSRSRWTRSPPRSPSRATRR
jgi:tellurite resistance protein TerC